MSHIIYQTEGIVLGKRDFGEADRLFTIFTEKFGKINAVAQGIRYLKSKLRCNLDLFSCSRIGLVSGKETWRIVDAEEINGSRKIIFAPENLKILSNIFRLIDRLVQGEEKNEFLWNEMKVITETLNKKKMPKEELEKIETESLLRALYNLGYIEKQEYKNKKDAVSAINKAIKESML